MKLLIKENYWVLIFFSFFLPLPPVSELLSSVTDMFRVYDEVTVTCACSGRVGNLG